MSSSTRIAFSALYWNCVSRNPVFSATQHLPRYIQPSPHSSPHPLQKSHYWANKRTWLNVYFIKQAWGWTTAAFLLAWATGPPSARTLARLSRWVTATGTWLLFTAWFFGPALFDRILLASGGECLLSLPDGSFLSLTPEYCHTRTALSPETHPALFASHSNSLTSFPSEWRTTPRLRKGHDVSGHIYLLTLSILLLAQQLGPSFALTRWSPPHAFAVIANCVLLFLWLLASGTTSVYFHSPQEKISGYLLGLICFAVSQIPAQLVYAWTKPAEKLHTS
ncbi:inositol phospholipid synthesis and fat-storage-inducing TM-domain-containing protein [Roridomyces roridus]|uniref:Inositol phospholipid synthesis and fat-storage-inducing TM-domain-containing protein n=1 Tax=Roridomyces roridus TaxID=1738132 RepID=A0AAD7FZY9_9AGAR|nr:inositol phospholipid synthesis and fat-storage-inducing TM-domain-containing protein [Roridomyces roridus]